MTKALCRLHSLSPLRVVTIPLHAPPPPLCLRRSEHQTKFAAGRDHTLLASGGAVAALGDGEWHFVAARRVAAEASLSLFVDGDRFACDRRGGRARGVGFVVDAGVGGAEAEPHVECVGNATNTGALDDAPFELKIGESCSRDVFGSYLP